MLRDEAKVTARVDGQPRFGQSARLGRISMVGGGPSNPTCVQV